MPDLMDLAQERQAMVLDAQISKARAVRAGRNVFFCDDCGELIPDARREILPGVETCTACQEVRESNSQIYAGKS
jgi:phage/conjugal plasmid C-4 type zinc finger TraR family protein